MKNHRKRRRKSNNRFLFLNGSVVVQVICLSDGFPKDRPTAVARELEWVMSGQARKDIAAANEAMKEIVSMIRGLANLQTALNDNKKVLEENNRTLKMFAAAMRDAKK